MIGLILLSVGFSTLIAFLMSLGFYFITPSIALSVFFITLALEWIIMEPLNRILRTKSIRAEAVTFSKLAKVEEVVGRQSVALECEYCRELNPVKINLHGDNAFTCSKCNNNNKVLIQFNTVRSTNPLDIVPKIPEEVADIIDELSELEE